MNWYKNIVWFALIFLVVLSCRDLERDVEIELPEVEPELVIECYLQPGEPYRVLLTETQGYFDDLDVCPFVVGATVVIEHNGIRDTLNESFYLPIDPCDDLPISYPTFLNTRFANYGSSRICPEDYNNNFKIEVWHEGRYATATTRMIPPVDITLFETEFDENDKAFVLLGAQDDGNEVNFYRLTLHEGSLLDDTQMLPTARRPEFDITLDDARFFNGETVSLGTNFEYEEGDTLIGTVYHIDRAYYDYLITRGDAESNNGNPFSQPGRILTNVEGGEGIFTFLSYDRDTLVVAR